jgi:hypothetical protein
MKSRRSLSATAGIAALLLFALGSMAAPAFAQGLAVEILNPPRSVAPGQVIRLRAQITGGRPPYRYQWKGTNIWTGPTKQTRIFTTAGNIITTTASFRRGGYGVLDLIVMDRDGKKYRTSVSFDVQGRPWGAGPVGAAELVGSWDSHFRGAVNPNSSHITIRADGKLAIVNEHRDTAIGTWNAAAQTITLAEGAWPDADRGHPMTGTVRRVNGQPTIHWSTLKNGEDGGTFVKH